MINSIVHLIQHGSLYAYMYITGSSTQPQEACQVLKCWTHFHGFTAQFHYPKEKTSGPQDKAAKMLRKSFELTFYKRMYGNKQSPSKCTQTSAYTAFHHQSGLSSLISLYQYSMQSCNRFLAKLQKKAYCRINTTTFFNLPDMFGWYICHLQCYIL